MNDINALMDSFLAGFDTRDGEVRVRQVADCFGAGAVVYQVAGDRLRAMTVEEFVTPREVLLSSGDVVGFHEWEVYARTFRFGSLAARVSRYEKQWSEGGTRRSGRGWKLLLLHRGAEGWRIAALAWADEADGLPIEDGTWSERGPHR